MTLAEDDRVQSDRDRLASGDAKAAQLFNRTDVCVVFDS